MQPTEGPPAQEGAGQDPGAAPGRRQDLRQRRGRGGLRAKYDQNVLTAECMLDC